MTWNWQHNNWPDFTYNPDALRRYEDAFLQKAGVMHGSLIHIGDEAEERLIVELLSEEALKTSEIEGEYLSRESLQSSIQKHFGIKGPGIHASPAEQGIADMMIDLYKDHLSPLSHDQVYKWHKMLCSGRSDLSHIGCYRCNKAPMQIVSNELYEPVVHFEAPPSKRVEAEMDTFILWFNDSNQKGKKPLPALARSGIAHLYFESIHPFEDGNGRIGRAISEKALSQNLGKPTLIAIAQMISSERKAYYTALQGGSQTLDIQGWLIYFCEMVLEAQDYTQSLIDFLIEKVKFYRRYAGQLNARQEKVIERLFKAGLDGFEGGLSADNYITISGVSRATVTRDLQSLVNYGALTKRGEKRYTRYFLNIDHPCVTADC